MDKINYTSGDPPGGEQAWWQSDEMAQWCARSLNANIEVEFVQELIRTFNLPPNDLSLELENWPWPVRIYTLGRFSLVKDDKPIHFCTRIQKRPLDFLKALISMGGRNVSKEKLTDALWPDAESDLAHQSFATTLHRLRKLIGQDAIQLNQGQVSLASNYCWVDGWLFERLLSRAGNELANNRLDNSWLYTGKAMTLYHGGFLEHETAYPWMLSLRESLRRKLLHHINDIGGRLFHQKRYQEAIKVYMKGLDIDELQESFYRGLMSCHHCLGQETEALIAYQNCEKILARVFRIEPSAETRTVLKKIKS